MNMIADIEYEDRGPDASAASKGTIICLHGIGGDQTSFAPQYQALANQFRVLSWSMPGYRGSTPLATLSFPTLCEQFIRWLDALGISQAHIVGHSIGGMLAQELALHHPNRVQSLILIGTTCAFGGRDHHFKDAFLKARLAPLDEGETMDKLAMRFVPEITGPIASEDAITCAIHSMANVPERTYRQIMQCLVTFNRRDEWPTIPCPTCLISGSEDSNAPARTMEKMAANLDDSEFHCIEGAGHLINLESADTCNDIIRRFLLKLTFS